jgi:hypothetical protein
MAPPSHAITLQALDTILHDFGVSRKPDGSTISFVGEIPSAAETKSHKINLSLIGTIPSLANAVLATQIYEARGGRRQNIEVDLRRGHNYIDPDIGMTPSINGQVGCFLALAFGHADLHWLVGNHRGSYDGKSVSAEYFRDERWTACDSLCGVC